MPGNTSRLRWPLALYVALALTMLLLVLFLSAGDNVRKEAAFRALGVSAWPRPYNDLYAMLGWIDCYRASYPRIECEFNYPLTILAFTVTGWGVKDVLSVGVAMEALFLAALIPVVWHLPRNLLWPFFVLFFSPPTLFALERGNLDVFLATLMIAAGCFGAAMAFSLVVYGTMLKYYPLGAAAILLSDRRRASVLWLIALAIVVGAFLLSPIANFQVTQTVNQQNFRSSYGWAVFPDMLDFLLNPYGIHVHGILIGMSLAATALILLGGTIFALVHRRPAAPLAPSVHSWLQASLGTYITCFLLGYSYEYRFILLLPAIPALLVAVSQKGWRNWEGMTVIAMIAAFWLTWDYRHIRTMAIEGLFCWALFGLSVPLLVWSLPEWTVSWIKLPAWQKRSPQS